MKCAWIGQTEIIPFDSIEYIDDASDDNTTQLEVHMYVSGKVCNIIGINECLIFKGQYRAYLEHMSKALMMIGDDDGSNI